MHTYAFRFDTPWNDIAERGWNHSRMLRDSPVMKSTGPQVVKLNPDEVTAIVPSGTLRLTQRQAIPSMWYSGDTDADRLGLDDFDHAPGMWDEHKIPGIMSAPNPATNLARMRSRIKSILDMNLIELLAVAAITAVEGSVLKPILQSVSTFEGNQGFRIEFDTFGLASMNSGISYLGVVFGDFCAILRHNAVVDLYWSRDGSLTEESWELRKRMWAGASGGIMSGSGERVSIMHAPASQNTASLTIEPFGRGNILFSLDVNGQRNDFVYSHPEARWDATELRYKITKPGKLGIYTNLDEAKNISLSASILSYVPSGTFVDERIELPYAPTVNPSVQANWVRALGAPTVTTKIIDDDGNDFVADGIKRGIRFQATLAGDGKCTPWLDSYHVRFDPLLKHYPGDEFTVDKTIQSVSFTHGLNWTDDRCTVVVRGKRDDPAHMALAARPEINAEFTVDGEIVSRWMFREPKVAHSRTHSTITLNGIGFGAARLAGKRFFWPPSFGEFTHPQVIESLLALCGFAPQEIFTYPDEAKLAETTKQGEDGDHGESDYRNQPKFGGAVTEYIKYVIDNYSPHPRWTLRYVASENRWVYGPNNTDVAPTVTFKSKNTRRTDGAPWFTDVETELIAPEANIVYLVGRDDANEYIGNWAVDLDYVGMDRPLFFVDTSLTTIETVNYCLRNLFEIAREAPLLVSWTGPWVSTLQPGDMVRIESLGDVQVHTISADVELARALEVLPSAKYTGKVIALDNCLEGGDA